MRRMGVAAVVVGLVAGMAAVPQLPVGATTPGTNGLIAFVRQANNCDDIYLVRADGGTTKLTKCPNWVGTPAWSPDAKTLAVSYIGPSDTRLKLALLKGTGGPVTTLTTGVGMSNSPAFSRDGSVLVFAGGDGGDDNLAIYTVPVSGGSATKLVGGGANGEANDEPDWSPTTDVIAWARKAPMSQTFDVWTMTVDASGHNPTAMTDLTNGQGSSRYPSWSPDGTKLAFASNRSGSWQIYVMDADGSNVVQLTTSGNHSQPAWSPDGKQIVYTTGCTTAVCATSGPNGQRQNGDLQVIDVTDLANPGPPQTVLNTSAGEFDPQWAPMCSGSGCPVTAIRQRTVRLTSIHRGVARGRVVGSDAPRACRAHVPVVLQYENVIDRGPDWPYPNRHWVKEGKGKTTATGRFHVHLPPRLTGWYRVKAARQRAGSQVCAAAASRLRVNYFIRDPRGDNSGSVDIAWADAKLRHHVVTFTIHTYTAFATSQKSTPCILFMKRVHDSHYNGSICFGGLAIHDELRHLTVKRPSSKTIVFTFKESELDPGFTNFEWGARSGVSDHDLYDILPSDFEIGNPHPVFDAVDTPFFFKHKPTYGHD